MKFRFTLLLLLILMLLCSCAGPAESEVTPPPTPATTVAPTAPTTLPTETAEPTLGPELTLEGVTHLSKQNFSASPTIAILDNRTAVFMTTEYLTDTKVTVTHLMTLDLYTDTILAELTLDNTYTLPSQSHLPGVLALFDAVNDECILFDPYLNQLQSFSCPEPNGILTSDLSSYYFISAQRISRLNIQTGEWSFVETGFTQPVESIRDYHPETNILLVDVHTQYYLTELCVGAVDLNTGEILVLNSDAKNISFTSDGILLHQAEVSASSDLTLTHWDSAEAMKVTGVMPCTDVDSGWYIPFSDYQMTLHYDSKQAYKLTSSLLTRFTDSWYGCDIQSMLNGMEPLTLKSLPDGKILALDYSKRGSKLALICPELLTFTELSTPETLEITLVDASIPEEYKEQSAYVEVSQEYAEVRDRANQLEERYGITILMSNQCDSIITQCGFELASYQSENVTREVRLLKDALDDLEDCLELYPEGFFSQFKNSANERGILILLIGNIDRENQDKNVTILGMTYDMGDWYPIAVDITMWDLPSTYCHELWHAMENKIKDENPILLNDVKWGNFNPSGFSYKGAVEGYYYDTEYTYLEGQCGTSSYFVDTYGKTAPYEDRARLMEYIMTTDRDAKYMMTAPALYNKMQMMIDAVRGVFDTTGWEDVYWERFHTK